MKQGKTLAALGSELERQRKLRKDFLADTRSLILGTNGGKSILKVTKENDLQSFYVGELAHQQISARLGIPYRYYQRMQEEQPQLLDENVETARAVYSMSSAPARMMQRPARNGSAYIC